MIKRALGLWVNRPGKNDSDDDSESDMREEVSQAQKKKMERRLVPGVREAEGLGPSRSGAPIGRESDSDGSDDEDGGAPQGGVEESDDEPAMPEVPKEEQFRGKFHCKLCPDKIIMSETALEDHLQSGSHKRNEKRFEYVKSIGIEAYEAECRARLDAREDAKGKKSRRQAVNEAYWQKKRTAQREKQQKLKARGIRKELTEEQIRKRQAKFQAKKARRLARKEEEAAAARGRTGRKAQAKGDAAAGREQTAAKKAKKTAAASKPEEEKRKRKRPRSAEEEAG